MERDDAAARGDLLHQGSSDRPRKTVKRGEAKKADYILYINPGLPIAVVKAKDDTHTVGAGMQQALEYAETLDLPCAYSSASDAFLEHDRTKGAGAVEREFPLDQFPTPAELWARYSQSKGLTPTQQPWPFRTTTTTYPASRAVTTNCPPDPSPLSMLPRHRT